MKETTVDLGTKKFSVNLPDFADILSMRKAIPFTDPEASILSSLQNPINTLPLATIARQKLQATQKARAVIVISDNTRPVPYSGESGILYPVIETLAKAGFSPKQVIILVASGTHRAMRDDELRKMLDPRVFDMDIRIKSHDSRNRCEMVSVGRTELGGEIFLNRSYVESDLKILTGLVESHFMAGVSGGRKSICPGLLAEESTYVLHSGPVLASARATNLILEGNPCHEEAVRVARMAGCDFCLNVTLDSEFRMTGIFAGDMEASLLKAYEKVRSYEAIPFEERYDLVITHAGLVGVNHYQAAKAAVVAAPLLEEEGFCILAALHTDPDPVGGENYKRMMKMLGEDGKERFLEKILDPSWKFVPEQWEAQMWTRLYSRIPPENLIYCSLEIPEQAFSWLPETNARVIVPETKSLQELMQKSIDWAVEKLSLRLGREPRIAFLRDGPYGIPVSSRPGSRNLQKR